MKNLNQRLQMYKTTVTIPLGAKCHNAIIKI